MTYCDFCDTAADTVITIMGMTGTFVPLVALCHNHA